eukprot:Phypoly_transcript_06846.p1 GENE.Phypoly_transcript_06846~~Phypoly_transcript_06846.p1  ORF type:complete len:395 (+),score=62.34 Phypoly_transcript_06846:211-1395(+)
MRASVAMPRSPSVTTISRGSKKKTKHPMIPDFAQEEESHPIEDVSYISYLQRTPSQDAKIGANQRASILPSPSSKISALFTPPTFPGDNEISLGPPTPPGEPALSLSPPDEHPIPAQLPEPPPSIPEQPAQPLSPHSMEGQGTQPVDHSTPSQSNTNSHIPQPQPDEYNNEPSQSDQPIPLEEYTPKHEGSPENSEFLFPSSKFFFSTLSSEDLAFEDVPLSTRSGTQATHPHSDTEDDLSFTPHSPDIQQSESESESDAEPTTQPAHNIPQLELHKIDTQPTKRKPTLQEPPLQQPAPQKHSPTQHFTSAPASPLPPNFGSKPMIVVMGQQVQTYYAVMPQTELPFAPAYQPIQVAYQPPMPQTITVNAKSSSSFWTCFVNPSSCFSCMRSQD